MEASKRERWFLFGAVPLLAAVAGAVATVIGQKIFGADASGDALVLISRDTGMSAAEKIQALRLVNENSKQFYEFLKSMITAFTIPGAALLTLWLMSRPR